MGEPQIPLSVEHYTSAGQLLQNSSVFCPAENMLETKQQKSDWRVSYYLVNTQSMPIVSKTRATFLKIC